MNLSISNMLLRISTFILLLLQTPALCQEDVAVKLSGSIWDDSTALKIPITVFKVRGSNIYEIGESKTDGDFVVNIPKDTEALLFQFGNSTKRFSIPTAFYGEFSKPVSVIFSLDVNTDNLLRSANISALAYGKPTSAAAKYSVKHFINEEFHCEIDQKNLSMTGNSSIDPNPISNRNSRFVLFLFDKNLQNVGAVNYKMSKGIVFIDTNLYEKEPNTTPSIRETTTDNFKVVIFNQSNYVLNEKELPKLDSLVRYCHSNPDKVVSIKGFTDGIGDSNKNEVLAMYRARVVGNYLSSSGIAKSRLKLDWEKGNSTVSHKGSLEQFRKVEITVK